jgi:methylmalonyl-CoA/ethylmalonyl-CoA epimerase
MIKKLNHIGIAVRSLENHIPFYRDVLSLPLKGIEEVADQKVRVAVFKIGEIHIELLEPTSPESAIAKFIEKKGEGLHHIALETGSIDQELAGLKAKGITLIDKAPRDGAHGTRIAFLHPGSTGKVLTEICQPGEDRA